MYAMSQHSPKIETVLETISPETSYIPESSVNLGITAFTETASVSFPQLLDFAFPPSAGETPVAQIGQITYVGDGVVHVVGLDKTSIDEIVEVYTSRNYIEKALILSVSQVLVEAVVLGDFS